MLDEIVDQAILKTIERAGVVCEDKDLMERVYNSIVTPLFQHISIRAGWIVYVIEMLASLIVVQTVLLVIILQRF
jgi:hypothetical protein